MVVHQRRHAPGHPLLEQAATGYKQYADWIEGLAHGGAAELGAAELAQRVTDYLAGMTDRYCIRLYTELDVPQAFAR